MPALWQEIITANDDPFRKTGNAPIRNCGSGKRPGGNRRFPTRTGPIWSKWPRHTGAPSGYDEFNQWCVRQRRGLPVSEVLAERREADVETRHRMTLLGRDAPLTTAADPYPAGLQASHYSSEYATHADEIGTTRAQR